MANPTSRFQPLAAPRSRPGCCFICRGTQNGPFIDTRNTVREPGGFQGAVIICRACIVEMHSQLDLPVELTDDEVSQQKAIEEAYANGVTAGRETTLEAFRGFVAVFEPDVVAEPSDLRPSDDSVDLAKGTSSKRGSAKSRSAKEQQGSSGDDTSGSEDSVESGSDNRIGGPASVSSDSSDGIGSIEF